jgi:hypothetical protein
VAVDRLHGIDDFNLAAQTTFEIMMEVEDG